MSKPQIYRCVHVKTLQTLWVKACLTTASQLLLWLQGQIWKQRALQVTFGEVCLRLSKLLITRRKSKNYTSSLKYSGPVVKGSVWGWWYSWAQHLESLSSTNELWWKTNVSTHTPLPSTALILQALQQDRAVFTLARMNYWLLPDPLPAHWLLTHILRVKKVHKALWILQTLYLLYSLPPVIQWLNNTCNNHSISCISACLTRTCSHLLTHGENFFGGKKEIEKLILYFYSLFHN